MVLQTISASKGEMGPMVASTLKLGIAILNGGNSTVQQKMLDYLKDKKDVGFFQSLAGLMPSCNVLDLNAFERQNKAEGLGMVTEEGSERQAGVRWRQEAPAVKTKFFLIVLKVTFRSEWRHLQQRQHRMLTIR
ncbi:ryanodine receptor 2 isoform X2 [Oreochromis niloticus]|uniref:ryanodine receptor 2 isoform X2 n=1 Tax=Oreochromis niloticus TaxID=8128 RepID=UPI000DF42022|nr:ryanodine receptor 2-like isoform X2 [Oreochromis niloticus]